MPPAGCPTTCRTGRPSPPAGPINWHWFEVTFGTQGCIWRVDDQWLRDSGQAPDYPLQLFVGVFDFPDRKDGSAAEHVPVFEVDVIEFEPAAG